MVIVDPKKEKNAIHEARKLGVTTVALIDTDCDPDLVDLPIPGNDDGIRSIEIIIRHLSDAVVAAKGVASGQAKGQEPNAGELAMSGAGADKDSEG
jgi:small subunit ribosomal protein S2